jgi:alpha-amylase/alpha-mannosidase (GH57 family)
VHLWHLTADAPRTPYRVSPGERVVLTIGSWPIEPNQRIGVALRIDRASGSREELTRNARWHENKGGNSYWRLDLGPFERGDKISYAVTGHARENVAAGPSGSFRVGPKLYLALLWHQHQPVYKDTSSQGQKGSYIQPWVRLHALRDYYSMASIVAEHPGVHVTFNLTPSLLWQLDDQLAGGATDRSLELSLKHPDALSSRERDLLLASFFDADRANQIDRHERYAELAAMRDAGKPFTTQDLRDLQMWFSLAWFGREFRTGEVQLVTGERVTVRPFIDKQRGFDQRDIEAAHDEQLKLMRAVIPVHRTLQEEGQIEVTTTPFFHPILPLLIDTDKATIDRPGAVHPRRFAHPEDAEAQVEMAVDYYRRTFRRRPRGMWPAEGAVSQSVVPLFARSRIKWIATDRGVLEHSGKHGYPVDDPDVVCRPYRAEEGGHEVSVFFRDTRLSDDIGFVYKNFADHDQAAHAFITDIKARFAHRLKGSDDRVLTVVVDGENAWGSYRDDGRPFLHALYTQLERDLEIQTVTFGEYLEGNAQRGLLPHPAGEQQRVYDLFTGSWIDEAGSRPGVDLGTWIGEDEENTAWDLLGEARDFLTRKGATPQTAPAAFEALYIAEGSDWFWWFGDDQDSGRDDEFDDLFRMHVANIYRAMGEPPPARVSREIVPHGYTWDFGSTGGWARPGDDVSVRTRCPGVLTYSIDSAPPVSVQVAPVGGVMAGTEFFRAHLGVLGANAQEVRFSFRCEKPDCGCAYRCCRPLDHVLRIA